MNFFQYELLYNDKSYNDKSLVISGENTLDQAVESVNKSAAYYLVECNYSPIKVIITEICNTCFNLGKIKKYQKRNKFMFKLITCPDCLGNVPTYKNEYKIMK
jgi:hypothetical protein